MADSQTDKKTKVAKAKEYLDELNNSLTEITTQSKEKMATVLKKNDEKKVSDILNQLKQM